VGLDDPGDWIPPGQPGSEVQFGQFAGAILEAQFAAMMFPLDRFVQPSLLQPDGKKGYVRA
jgi:hypothetical protein